MVFYQRPQLHTAFIIAPVLLLVALIITPAASSSSSSSLSSPSAMPTSNNSNTFSVFSDVDGTLVHYPAHLQGQRIGGNDDHSTENDKEDHSLLYLPPSKTGTRGIISKRTLQLVHELRYGSNEEEQSTTATCNSKAKTPFILISGMRTTTLFQRLPYLPRADAYVCESGGRIFYPRSVSGLEEEDGLVKDLDIHPVSYTGIASTDATPFVLVEDMEWRHRISQANAAGTDGYTNNDDCFPIEKRKGKLWEFASSLIKDGHVLDTSDYATSFRVNRKHQRTDAAMSFDEFLDTCCTNKKSIIPDGLDCSTNLGCVDVYPAMSGKRNGAEYLVRKLLQQQSEIEDANVTKQQSQAPSSISLKTNAYCLCDDDNDIEMALASKRAYLPSITSDSIRKLVNQQHDEGRRSSLIVTEDKETGIVETLATEAALEAIIKELE